MQHSFSQTSKDDKRDRRPSLERVSSTAAVSSTASVSSSAALLHGDRYHGMDTNRSNRISNHRSISDIMSNALTFGDSEQDLLRATDLACVLHKGARILRDKAGNNFTFDQSKPVEKIDYFLSHNWSVSGFAKFVSLTLTFNLGLAFAVAACATILCFILHFGGIVPMIKPFVTVEDLKAAGFVSQLAATPTFLVALWVKFDICKFLGRGPLCFLDKTCIHQTDFEMKKKGIEKLGAFLSNSSRILVLYSDVYLKKLWTIYEVACFGATHNADDMHIVHVDCTKLFFQLLIASYFLMTLRHAHNLFPASPISPTEYSFSVYGLGAIAFSRWARNGHRKLADTWKFVEHFEVKKATCFDEADRPVVEKNIAAFMIFKGYTSSEASKEEALASFDRLVRGFVLQSMKASLGTSPLPFLHTVIFFLLIDFSKSLDVIAGLSSDDVYPFVFVLSYSISTFAGATAYFPLALEITSWLMSKAMHLLGWKEWAWILMGAASFFAFNWLFYFRINVFFSVPLHESNTRRKGLLLAIQIAYNVGWQVASFTYYRWQFKAKRKKFNTLNNMTSLERSNSYKEDVEEAAVVNKGSEDDEDTNDNMKDEERADNEEQFDNSKLNTSQKDNPRHLNVLPSVVIGRKFSL